VSVPADCGEVLYAAIAATLSSPYMMLGSDSALAAAYAPPRLQREISSFISLHCGGEADTWTLVRYITAPMPIEMYDPEEKTWSRTSRNPAEMLRRYGLLQPTAGKERAV
jgi:cell wall-associated NlpC family hydrolase